MGDISLKLYKDFFDEILCNRKFLYELEDGAEINLVFKSDQLMHILGAQHILGNKYKATKFNKEIIDGKMTFEELEKKNSIVFNDYTSRFLSFSNLYYVITNCKLIYFDKDIYNKNKKGSTKSKMEFSHILYEDINNKRVHAGIDTYNNGFSFYCKSLLVKSISNDSITKNQVAIKIKNIKVIDTKNQKVILDKDIEKQTERYVAVGQADKNGI